MSKQIRIVLSALFIAAAGGVVVSHLPGCSRASDVKKGSVADSGGGEFPDSYFFDTHDDPDQQFMNELVGKKMPELSVSDWTNGQVTPAEMKGKVVLVDIWATWCGPCIASIPHNNEMYKNYKERGLVIAAVCTDEKQDKLPAVIKEKEIAYPVCRDPEMKTAAAYHVKGYPTYVAVDRKGIVRAIGLKPDHVEDVVKKLLDEKP